MWHQIHIPGWLRYVRTLQGKAEYFPTCYKVQKNILINAREFGIRIEVDCGNEKSMQKYGVENTAETEKASYILMEHFRDRSLIIMRQPKI